MLYLSLGWSDASFAKITSVASQTVEASLPSSVHNTAFAKAKQYRFKREVTTKQLEDPKGCIQHCRSNESSAIMTATIRNMGRLVGIALQDIKGDETSTPEKEAAFKKQIEEKVVANMGPFFGDLCKISKNADNCYTECPESELRSIMAADQGATETFCEPGKNWKTFSDYWYALNCTNTTEESKPCDKRCGEARSISNVTSLEIDDDEESETVGVKYENDSKKNTAAANSVCKTTSCQLECYKPIISEKCGAKAYDLYNRMTKMEPPATLRILKILNAVDEPSDCKAFQA